MNGHLFTILQGITEILLDVIKEVLSGHARKVTFSLMYFILKFSYMVYT